MDERVAFVGHDASRTGAPVHLLTFLRWLRSRRLGRVELLLGADGPLEVDYRSVVATTVLSTRATRMASWASRAAHSVGAPGADRVDLVDRRAVRRAAGPILADTVVSNTVASLHLAAGLAGPDRRLVCHVHELDHVVERVLPDQDERRRLFDQVDMFVAAGDPVARMLIERHGIPPHLVRSVAPFVEPRSVPEGDVVEARRRLTGGAARSVVVSIGPVSPRKGPDRFLDLLAELDRDLPDLLGAFIGSDSSQASWTEVHDDRDRLGLTGSTVMLGQLVDPLPTIAAADVIVSTAREDPFPLGLLEAAAMGTPVVTFDSGGFGALAAEQGLADWVVPVGDTLAMRDAVLAVLSDPVAARARAARLQRVVTTNHSPDRGGPVLWDAILGRST